MFHKQNKGMILFQEKTQKKPSKPPCHFSHLINIINKQGNKRNIQFNEKIKNHLILVFFLIITRRHYLKTLSLQRKYQMNTNSEVNSKRFYEDFEPLCVWKRDQGHDLEALEVHLQGSNIIS